MSVHTPRKVEIHGYSPGVVGKITEAHAVYYHAHWDFDVSFETQVGRELSEFVAELREGRDGLRVAMVDGRFAGSIAIDGRQAAAEGARLRWFLVLPELQGTGIGRLLIEWAVAFCDGEGYSRTYLWTFQGLEAARSLYERAGFRLTCEHDVLQWGRNLREQRFEREGRMEGR